MKFLDSDFSDHKDRVDLDQKHLSCKGQVVVTNSQGGFCFLTTWCQDQVRQVFHLSPPVWWVHFSLLSYTDLWGPAVCGVPYETTCFLFYYNIPHIFFLLCQLSNELRQINILCRILIISSMRGFQSMSFTTLLETES